MTERRKHHRSLHADEKLRRWFCETHPREILAKDYALRRWWCPRCRRDAFARFAAFAGKMADMPRVAVFIRETTRTPISLDSKYGRMLALVGNETDEPVTTRYRPRP